MKLSFNKFAYSISALCLILTGVWWFWDEYAASETASFQETPGWQNWKDNFPANADPQHLESNDPEIPEETKPSVLIRSDSAKKALLLKHNYANDVFIYDSITETTRQASEDEWTKADGEITRCRAQIGSWFGTDIEINSYPTYRIIRNGKKVETYGKYALYAVKSPSWKNLAALSAYGPVKSAGRGLVGLGGSDPDVYG